MGDALWYPLFLNYLLFMIETGRLFRKVVLRDEMLRLHSV